MARLEFSLEHGQPPELAQDRFEAGIAEMVARFGSWIGRIDWSDDRRKAMITGSNYQVHLWYDERFLHARGQIPMAWKLIEPAVRNEIRRMIAAPA